MSLLSLRNLSLSVRSESGTTELLHDINLSLEEGESLALVGESGSGKSLTALSVLRLLNKNFIYSKDSQIEFNGLDILTTEEKTLQSLRGNEIGIIFQEPLSSLNPLHTIEKQIAEVILCHKIMGGKEVRAEVIRLLHLVGIADGEERLKSYPHELSGGQRQRVMIAMAIANEPKLLIADEPTTALDVVIKEEILSLLMELKDRLGMAVLFITHDLPIVKRFADRVMIMQEGRIVEEGNCDTVFSKPKQDYTKELLHALNRKKISAGGKAEKGKKPLLECCNLSVGFKDKGRSGIFRTVYKNVIEDISLQLYSGRTVAIVGESGSGKTSLGLALLRLLDSKGEIYFCGERVDGLSESEFRKLRVSMQVIFQDPFGSLSPRMSVGDIIAEGLRVLGLGALEIEERVANVCDEVGLDLSVCGRYPHEFSGGQRQRIAIARAYVMRPQFLLLDEPTSALDVSVQGRVIDLLLGLQERHGLGYLFISHDMGVVRAVADDVIVMRGGRVIERGSAEDIFNNPRDDYTKELMRYLDT